MKANKYYYGDKITAKKSKFHKNGNFDFLIACHEIKFV